MKDAYSTAQSCNFSIFRVGRVVTGNTSVGAVHKSGFIAKTLDIIVQEDGTMQFLSQSKS